MQPETKSHDPLGELTDEECEKLIRHQRLAAGNVRSALEILDGDGGDIREKFAEAYGALMWLDTALKAWEPSEEGENE